MNYLHRKNYRKRRNNIIHMTKIVLGMRLMSIGHLARLINNASNKNVK